jgi:hypothetical protein
MVAISSVGRALTFDKSLVKLVRVFAAATRHRATELYGYRECLRGYGRSLFDGCGHIVY